MIRGRKESNRALNPSLTHTWNGGPVPAVIWSLTWLTIVRLNLIVIPTFPFTKRVRKVCPVWKAPWFIQPTTDLLPVSESILNMAETLGTTFSPVLWVNTDCLPSMIDSVVNHCLSLTDWGVLYTHTFADRLCCSSNWSTHTHTCVYVVVLPSTSSLPHIVPFKQQADPHTHTHAHTHCCVHKAARVDLTNWLAARRYQQATTEETILLTFVSFINFYQSYWLKRSGKQNDIRCKNLISKKAKEKKTSNNDILKSAAVMNCRRRDDTWLL